VASEEALRVSLISPAGSAFEGEADMVVVPAWDGEVGVLRGHAPMLVLLGSGDVRVRRGLKEERFAVSGGFLQVIHNDVTILSEQVEAVPV
jgi:F-type H+-transporting ATPase subunit epsilon